MNGVRGVAGAGRDGAGLAPPGGRDGAVAPAVGLEVAGLRYAAGERVLLDGVDLRVSAGETVGLVGPNGSGKTTLLRCVYGALRPAGGRVLLGGEETAGLSVRERARRVAVVPQDAGGEAFGLTVREVVAMGRFPHRRFWEQDRAEDVRRVERALRTVGADGLAGRRFGELSGGERQRVLVARALVQEPGLLALDEPTNHLDVRFQLEILGLVRALGTSNLLVLHDLNLAAAFCDRLYVLDAGRVVADGVPGAVLTEELLAEVYRVRARVGAHPVTGVPNVMYVPFG